MAPHAYHVELLRCKHRSLMKGTNLSACKRINEIIMILSHKILNITSRQLALLKQQSLSHYHHRLFRLHPPRSLLINLVSLVWNMAVIRKPLTDWCGEHIFTYQIDKQRPSIPVKRNPGTFSRSHQSVKKELLREVKGYRWGPHCTSSSSFRSLNYYFKEFH